MKSTYIKPLLLKTTGWTRRFYLQATYYFGDGKSKSIKAASLNEETNRM